MTAGIIGVELRLRGRMALSAAVGLMALTAGLGALFPSLQGQVSGLNLPHGVTGFVGGSDFSTIAGWLGTEVMTIYGPFVLAAVAITAATATTAGEEENHILTLVLAHPVPRRRLILAKASAVGALLTGLAVAVFAGMLLAVVLAGASIPVGDLAAGALHLLLFGLAVGALALAFAACTGHRGLAVGAASAITVLMYVFNGLASLVGNLSWLKYLSVFHYAGGQDPLTTGAHPLALATLAAAAIALATVGAAGFARRDLRG